MTGFMEFLTFCIAPINLLYTVLLGLVVLYWCTVFLGALDMEFLDIDFDLDMDGDADFDLDMDGMAGGSGGLTSLQHVLSFIHIGVVPLTLVLSILILFLWMTAVITHYVLSPVAEMMALLLFFPELLLSVLLTRLTIAPLVPTFKSMKARDGSAYENLIGKTCTVISGKVTSDFGQAEVETGGSPITLNVQIGSGPDLTRGDEAVIVEHREEDGVYIIKKL